MFVGVAVRMVMMVVIMIAVGMFVRVLSTPGAIATSDGGCGSNFLPEQQHHCRAKQREQRDEPDLVEKVHAVTT